MTNCGVFFIVTLMFNPLFFPLSSLFSKKYELGMILKQFSVKIRLASEKLMPLPQNPHPELRTCCGSFTDYGFLI